MLIRCAVCHTMNRIPWMPDDTTPLMCRECGHHFTSEYVTEYVRKLNEDNIPPVAEGFFLKLAGIDGSGRITTQDRFINTVRAMLNESYVATHQKLLAAQEENNLILIDKSLCIQDIKQLHKAFDIVAKWLSAALDDPKVCDEMKADIRKAFEMREDH